MKVTKREILLLTILFVFICGFLYYRLYFSPAEKKISALNSELDALTLAHKDLELKQKQIETLKKQASELKSESFVKLYKVMGNIDQPEMLMTISDIIKGQSSGSTFSFPREYKVLDNCRIYSVQAGFLTDYDSLKRILSGLNGAHYVNRVIMGSLGKARRPVGIYNIDAELSIEFFTLDNPSAGSPHSFMTGVYPNLRLFP